MSYNSGLEASLWARCEHESPSARDRWIAFHRLYRLATRTSYGIMFASECFRVLMSDWRWIQLVEEVDDPLTHRRLLPKDVRRTLARMETKKRELYG